MELPSASLILRVSSTPRRPTKAFDPTQPAPKREPSSSVRQKTSSIGFSCSTPCSFNVQTISSPERTPRISSNRPPSGQVSKWLPIMTGAAFVPAPPDVRNVPDAIDTDFAAGFLRPLNKEVARLLVGVGQSQTAHTALRRCTKNGQLYMCVPKRLLISPQIAHTAPPAFASTH